MKYFKNITVRLDDNDLKVLDDLKKIYKKINPIYKDITTSQIIRAAIVYLYLDFVRKKVV